MMDVYSVLYSPAAKDDLFGVYSYIATELLEPEIAAMQTDRIRKAIRSLEHLPLRYAHVDWEPWLSMGMRKLIVDNYIAFSCTMRLDRLSIGMFMSASHALS